MPASTSSTRDLRHERIRRATVASRGLIGIGLCVFFLAMCFVPVSARQSSRWPGTWWRWGSATWMIDIFKTAGDPASDAFWANLATPHATMTLGVRVTDWSSGVKQLSEVTDIQVRYMVHGVPVSPWLNTPFNYTLSIDNPAFEQLADGVHDISIDAQGSGRDTYSFRPMYLHLSRGRAVSPLVPVLGRDCQYCDFGIDFGPGVVYVNRAEARFNGHPVSGAVQPWHGNTNTEPDLYQEEMAPHSDLFFGHQMWWEQESGPHTGAKYTRALVPKWDEDHRGLRTVWHQDRLPFRDGPRGIAWVSPYSTGQVDSTGGFAFAEAGGPVRYMTAQGTVTTVVGWRVRADKDPIYITNPTSVVRRNMEFRGTFQHGRYADGDGFRTPLDVAIDPQNEHIWYIAGYEDQVIWRVDATDLNNAIVSVFAGDVNHSPGFADGAGLGARFNGPASVVFDPVCDCLYVADQNNDAVRKITRGGVVTTLFGSPGQDKRQVARGVTTTSEYQIQGQNRSAAGNRYETTAADRSLGVMPETYLPQTVRVDSAGNIILLDIGFGAIRRVNPTTLVAHHLVSVMQRFLSNDEEASGRGWAWLEVDRWGNSGPLDSIYYGAFQGGWCDGEPNTHVNEAYCWTTKDGGRAYFLFNDWDPNPDGWGARESTDPPHYMWTVAVDPRGAVLLAGGGEHGITRLRKRRATDPVPPNYEEYLRAKDIWRYTLPSFALKFGWEGHGYLGFADAYDYKDATDQQIIDAFEIPSDIRNDPHTLSTLLMFIRVNGGKVMSGWTPTPGGGVPTKPTSQPAMSIEAPGARATVPQPFVVAGWALDAGSGASSGSGVDMVHVWACPIACTGANGVFWGAADYGGARPDVGTTFGDHRFDGSAFGLAVSERPAGVYQVVVYARSAITQQFQSSTMMITVMEDTGSRTSGETMQLTIDAPSPGDAASQPFIMAGWAADVSGGSGTGVDVVQVWTCSPICTGANAVPMGTVVYGFARPDVAAALGNSRFTASGYGLVVNGLTAGQYEFVVKSHSTASGRWQSKSAFLMVQSAPLMWVDRPGNGQTVGRPFTILGWALDPGAASDSGVDAVHVWAYLNGSSTAIFLGAANQGSPRPDVAAAFGPQFSNAGWWLTLGTLSPGNYQVVVYSHSRMGASWAAQTLSLTVN